MYISEMKIRYWNLLSVQPFVCTINIVSNYILSEIFPFLDLYNLIFSTEKSQLVILGPKHRNSKTILAVLILNRIFRLYTQWQ